MQLGANLPLQDIGGDPGVVRDYAQAAEEMGFDFLGAADHVIGVNAATRPDWGERNTSADLFHDPFVLYGFLSACTKKIGFSTQVLILAQRQAALVAKQAACVDVLSGGRFRLGVGVGWQREEYEANGVPHAHRGARLDQTLEICQTLWREQSASYRSEEVNFEKIHCMPKPLQPGGVPLWISGTLNANVRRRIVRFGTGWIPWGPDALNPVAGLGRIREDLEAAGRNPKDFQVTSYLPILQGEAGAIDLGATMEAVPAMAEAGITDLRATLNLPGELQAATDFLSPIVEAFRQAAGRT